MQIVRISETEFEKLYSSPGPFLVLFAATWVRPCRQVESSLNSIAQKYERLIEFTLIDVDENQILARKFNVRSVPTVLVFRNGEILTSLLGAMPTLKYDSTLKSLL